MVQKMTIHGVIIELGGSITKEVIVKRLNLNLRA
jgi:hypothetical protein